MQMTHNPFNIVVGIGLLFLFLHGVLSGQALHIQHLSVAPTDGEENPKSFWGLLILYLIGAVLLLGDIIELPLTK